MTAIIAHRGASRAELENTVQAFRRAAGMGADGVELDVRRTAEGALVVHHDAHLDDGRLICETDRIDLPAHVPSLDEALAACAGMWVNVEIKNDPTEPDFDPTERIADETIRSLIGRGEDERWLISSFRMATIDRCRLLAPTIRTAWLTEVITAAAIREVVSKGHLAIHPWHGTVTAAQVEACHAAGVQVNVWTCDDPAAIARLAAWGTDGICTNVPDVAIAVLAGLNRENPPATPT